MPSLVELVNELPQGFDFAPYRMPHADTRGRFPADSFSLAPQVVERLPRLVERLGNPLDRLEHAVRLAHEKTPR
jgi:hypothetical protein